MLRNVLARFLRIPRRPHSGTTHASTSTRMPGPHFVSGRSGVMIATTAAMFLWYLSGNRVHNDAARLQPANPSSAVLKRTSSTGLDEDGALCVVVWGSNKSNVIDPQSSGIETFQVPVNAKWLRNVALRDLALHERHAACVDARGDVYQWGNGFFGSQSDDNAPRMTLCGKNIIKIQLTDSRVYALSASGRIYVFAASKEQQKLPEPRTSSTTRWSLPGRISQGQTIDFIEISPKEKLKWGETFVSIAAGSNHLLALTSEGRTYTHPMNKDANSHGQLGLQKVEIPTPPGLMHGADRSHIDIELSPRSAIVPHAKTSLFVREPSSAAASEHFDVTDGSSIGFWDGLFEIPSLKGVKVSQIAAGSRTSFVNTSSGRVLGWGANDHGQIGLGPGITLNSIIIPTEIVLSRNTPVSTRSRCLNITTGGDLTYFVVERTTRESLTHVDVLCCGNGQWGGLGNNTFSTYQGNPVRVKNISGLREFDQREQKLIPIVPHTISVSPTGHVLLSLDTQTHANPASSGRDLVVWGPNHDYQLGTSKRGSLNTATVLERPNGDRFILAKCKATVRDLLGNIWKRNAEVEQCAVAGYGSSIVYWKIKP